MNPAGIDLAHVLPDDWVDRVLQHECEGNLAPLFRALQAIVRKHGEAAIAIEHVQELALLVCGLSSGAQFRPYERVFASLIAAAGDGWPLTTALDEQPLDQKPVFDAAQRLTTCDGEWLALHGLVDAGWLPTQASGRTLRDWTVTKGGVVLPVEVKTKQSQGSDLGRLRFALRGLSMTRDGSVLRRFVLNWSGATDLTRKAISAYYRLLRANLLKLNELVYDDLPLYDVVQVATTEGASLSVQRYETNKFALDFKFVDPSVDELGKNDVSLILEPNSYPRYSRIGAVDALFFRESDVAMLDEFEIYVLDRLGIAKQAKKRSAETVVVVIWEVPFHWRLDLTMFESRWQAWSATAGVAVGVLAILQAMEPPAVLLTREATTLFTTVPNPFA